MAKIFVIELDKMVKTRNIKLTMFFIGIRQNQSCLKIWNYFC